MKLVFLGDSHVRALGSSYNLLPLDRRRQLLRDGGFQSCKFGQLFSFPLVVKPFFTTKDSVVELNDINARSQLARVTGKEVFDTSDPALVYCLSLAFTTTLLVRDPVWREHCPSVVWAKGGGAAMSEGVMKAIILGHFKWVFEFHAALKSAGMNLISFESPPPRLDDLSIGRGARPEVVLEVDRIARLITATHLSGLGIPIVRAPVECYLGPDRTGFLKAEYAETANGDVHHANSEFGALMLPLVLSEAIGVPGKRSSVA
jgi:hypothetical protein